MGARLYNPGTGRSTSVDPVTRGNENAYNYPKRSHASLSSYAEAWVKPSAAARSTSREARTHPTRGKEAKPHSDYRENMRMRWDPLRLNFCSSISRWPKESSAAFPGIRLSALPTCAGPWNS